MAAAKRGGDPSEPRGSARERSPGGASTRHVAALAIGASGSAGAAALILLGHRAPAGASGAVAAAALIAGTPPSRWRGTRTWFFSRVLDRTYDFALLLPLAWVERPGSARVAVLALVAAAAAYLAGYELARGEALGYRGADSLAYRGVRMGLLVLAVATAWTEIFLWAAMGVALGAVAVATASVVRQEREANREPDGAHGRSRAPVPDR